MVKFVTEIVTGECPECDCKTMLVNIYTNIYRCVNCGSDCKQYINGAIRYLPAISRAAKPDKDVKNPKVGG